jgi:leucyl-tRNA synthetase
LYDIGAVSTVEPFQRLVSQGMILGEVEFTVYRDTDGSYVDEGTRGASAVRSKKGTQGKKVHPLCV